MRAHLVVAAGLTVLLALAPSNADAQASAFADTVRDLTRAAAQPEPLRINGLRAAADRMRTALAEWDRHIRALEARVARELPAAIKQQAYQLHVELGETYRTRGRFEDALREFDAAVALQPSASDVYTLRARALEDAGRQAEARQALRTAWQNDAQNPVKAYAVVAAPGGAPSDREAARALLKETSARLVAGASPPSPVIFPTYDLIPDTLSAMPVVAGDARTAGAFTLLLAGKFDQAATVLTQQEAPAGIASKETPAAHLARGQASEAQNRVGEARKEYEAALAGTLAGRSAIYVGIGRLAEVDGDLPGAVEAFGHAARLAPNNALIHKELANAYAADGRADEASCELVAALLIDPRDGQALAMVGQIDLDAGRDADAVTAFNRALDVAPDRYETRYVLAQALTRLGRQQEAAHQLELFDKTRRELLERRRRAIANEVEQDEAVRQRLIDQGSAR